MESEILYFDCDSALFTNKEKTNEYIYKLKNGTITEKEKNEFYGNCFRLAYFKHGKYLFSMDEKFDIDRKSVV